jgi:hypothetical protein
MKFSNVQGISAGESIASAAEAPQWRAVMINADAKKNGHPALACGSSS